MTRGGAETGDECGFRSFFNLCIINLDVVSSDGSKRCREGV